MDETQSEYRQRQAEYQRRHRAKPGVRAKYAKLNREWIARNRVRYNEAKAEYRFKLKMEALRHYSGGSMSCAQCGYSGDVDALCLDHVNNDGAEHRKQLGCSSRGAAGGTTIYERLKASGWMTGLQVLCFNCNTIKELRRKRGGRTSAEMALDVQLQRGWR